MNFNNIVSVKRSNTTMLISVLYIQPPKHSYKPTESHEKPLEATDDISMSSYLLQPHLHHSDKINIYMS